MIKKLYLCGLIVLSASSLASASVKAEGQYTDATIKRTAYSELRDSFKERLSKKQYSLSKLEYYEFIELYLQQAEKDLQIIRYLINAQEYNKELFAHYFDRLIFLNGADYLHQMFPDKELWTRFYQINCNKFKNIINEFIKEASFENLDVEREFEATLQLFKDANKSFVESHVKQQKAE